MPSSPTVLAGGQLGLLSRSEVAVAGAAAEDLLEALGRVPDPRDPRGRRYPLVPVLAIAVCAMLAGARSYAAIAEWAADAPPRLRARLGLPGPVPDLATIWRVLTTVDPAAVDRAVGAWVSAQLATRRPTAQVVLAVDGKTVRGARTGDGTAPHLLACLDHAPGWCSPRSLWTARRTRSPCSPPRWPRPATWTACWSPRTRCTPSVSTPPGCTSAARTTWSP